MWEYRAQIVLRWLSHENAEPQPLDGGPRILSLWRKNSAETAGSEANKCLLREKREKIGVEKAQMRQAGRGAQRDREQEQEKMKATRALEVLLKHLGGGGDPPTLSVGMYIGTTTTEKSMEILPKLKTERPYDPAILLQGTYLKKKPKTH